VATTQETVRNNAKQPIVSTALARLAVTLRFSKYVCGQLVANGTLRIQTMHEELSAPRVSIARLRLANESATLAARGSL
jgi:hypothetical protein